MPQKPEPRPVHWRPILAAGLVGRALGAMRPDDVVSRLRHLDVVTRLRHLVLDRIPGHLAVAAAVPLMVMLAIFVFERGFTVGVEMRQRAPSAPATMRSSPPEPTPSLVSPPPTTAPVQGPPAPALPARSASAPAPAAPSSVAPPAAKAKITETKAPETKAVDVQAVTRSAKLESIPKQDKPAPAAVLKSTPAKSAPVSAPPAASEPARKEAPSKNVAVARAAPNTRDAATAAAAEKRRGSVDVVGRLQVKNRSEAERELAALVARAGGTSLNRQQGPAITVVQAAVPHANYGKFAQGVVRLGSWRIEAERSPLPDLVQVTVRLAE
jgi:hypothetical protein